MQFPFRQPAISTSEVLDVRVSSSRTKGEAIGAVPFSTRSHSQPTMNRMPPSMKRGSRMLPSGGVLALALLMVGCGASDPTTTGGPTDGSEGSASERPSSIPKTATPVASSTPVAAAVVVDTGSRAQVGDVIATDLGWLLVGSLDGLPAIWSSPDGISWDRERIGPVGQRPGHLTAVAAHQETWLAAGWTSAQAGGGFVDRPVLLSGTPGGLWIVHDALPVPDGLGGLLTDVVSAAGATVVTGTLSDGTPSSWRSSDDGATWDGPAALPSDPGSSVAAVTYYDGAYLAVGERVGANPGAAVWHSSDGLTWAIDELSTPGSLTAAVATSSGVIAVGQDGSGSAMVWSLSELMPRRLEPPDLPDLNRVALSDDRLLVASPSPVRRPVHLMRDGSWEPVELGTGDLGSVRALAASSTHVAVAGDDGQQILFAQMRVVGD